MPDPTEGLRGAKFFASIKTDKLPPEVRKNEFTRTEVLGAFNGAFAKLVQIARNEIDPVRVAIIDKWNANPPEDPQLTPDEADYLRNLPENDPKKKLLNECHVAIIGKKLTLDQNRDSFPAHVESESGTPFDIEERIPVEGLLEQLHLEIQRLRTVIRRNIGDRAANEHEMQELMKYGRILYKSSKPYPSRYKVGRNGNIRSNPLAYDRARKEAYQIYRDAERDRRTPENNFLEGIWTMQNRRELYIPPATATITVTPPLPLTVATTTTTPNVNVTTGTQTNVNVAPVVQTPNVNVAPNVQSAVTGTPRVEPATPTPQPATVEERRDDYQLNLGNRTEDPRKRAAEIVEQQIREQMRGGSIRRDFGNWIWRKIGLRIFEEYYRQKWIERAVIAMTANNNSYLQMDVVRNVITDANAKRTEEKAAGKATLERIRNRKIAGEKVIEVQEGPLKTIILNELLHPLIQELRSGTAVNEGIIQQRLREFVRRHENDPDVTIKNQINEIFGKGATQYKRLAEYFASDMLELSQKIVGDMNAHHLTLDAIDRKINITLSNATWAAETKAHFNTADKIIADMQAFAIRGVPVGGWFANPAAIGMGISLTSFFLIRLPGTIGRKIAPFAAPLIGSIAGGSVAGLRRNMDLKRDMASHRAERAYGAQKVTKEQIDAQIGPSEWKRRQARLLGAYRRADLEEFAYDTATSSELLNGGGTELLVGAPRKSMAQLMSADLTQQPNREAIVRRISEIGARLDNSHTWETDLIEFTGRETVEQGRLGLIKAMVEAKQALRRAGMTDADITTLETRLTNDWTNNLAQIRAQKDKAFKGYRVKQAVGAGVFGFGVGLAGSLIGQEMMAGISRGIFHANVGPTTLERVWDDLSGHRSIVFDQYPTIDGLHDAFNHGGKFALGSVGNHHEMIVDAANNVNIVDEHGVTLNNVPMHLDANGHITAIGKLDPNIQQELLNEHIGIQAGPSVTETVMGNTLNSRIETILVNGHQVQVTLPQGELPDHTLWHSVLRPNGDGSYNVFAVRDTGPNAGTDILFSDGKPVVLADHLKFDDTGHLISGNTINGAVIKAIDVKIGEHQVLGPADPNFVHDLQSGKEVLGNNGYSFRADPDHVLHVYQNGQEIKIYDPTNYLNQQVKVNYIDGRAFIDYEANPQNTIPDRLLDAIKSTNGSVVPDNHFGTPRISDLDWQNHLKGIEVFNTQTRLLTDSDMIPRVPWPATATGEHFPFTAKAFDHFFDNGHFDAHHFFSDGDVVTEGGVRVIKFDNGALLYGSSEMMDAYMKVKAGGPDAAQILHDKFAFWYGKPDDWNAGVLRSSTMEADIPSQFKGKVWGSFGFIENDGKLHKLAGFGPTESLHTPISLRKMILEPIMGQQQIIGLPSPITEQVPTFDLAPPVEIPPIAIPFAFRHPLDEIEGYRQRYYYAGLPSPEDRTIYAGRRSPRLNSNPRAVLSPEEEMRWYFGEQPREYVEDLDRMNNLINDPMSGQCRVSVCIAAASHHEGKNIYKTLSQYLNQKDNHGNPINYDQYEIVLFLNRPSNFPPDDTAKEVDRFKREHPELKVRVFEKTFPNRPSMGVISKYVADMALLRSSKRSHPSNPDLIIANNDADADLISNKYISSIVAKYDDPNKKHIDGALGKIEWTPEAYIKFPGFHVANRFYQIIEAGRRHEKKREIGSSGANFTIKSSMYAAIGGFNTSSDLAQDVELSRMLLDARRPGNADFTPDDYPLDYINAAWVVTSPRRGISTYLEGRPVVNQWDDFSSRQAQVRLIDWKTFPSTETVDTLDMGRLEREINAGLRVYGVNPNSDLAKRALTLLNIGYRVENGVVKITDITKLKEDLRKYKDQRRDKINELKNT